MNWIATHAWDLVWAWFVAFVILLVIFAVAISILDESMNRLRAAMRSVERDVEAIIDWKREWARCEITGLWGSMDMMEKKLMRRRVSRCWHRSDDDYEDVDIYVAKPFVKGDWDVMDVRGEKPKFLKKKIIEEVEVKER